VKHFNPAYTLFVLILTTGCDFFNITPEVSINFQDPTDVTESGFQVIWSINPSDYKSLVFDLALDPSFQYITASRHIYDSSINSVKFDSLRGATTYYYHITLVREPGNLLVSPTKSVETGYVQDQISFMTPDSAVLKGEVTYLGSMAGDRPGVIMMHEFGVALNGWLISDILKSLVADGYIALTFTNRGHGRSSPMGDANELLTDPRFLSNDLKGAINFLKERENVQPDSLALLGSSMGASMAVAGNGFEEVITSIALSAYNNHIYSIFPEMQLKSVLYIAGADDKTETPSGVVDYPGDARALYAMTANPRKLLIIPSSSLHGTGLLESPQVNDEIINWIRLRLPIQ